MISKGQTNPGVKKLLAIASILATLTAIMLLAARGTQRTQARTSRPAEVIPSPFAATYELPLRGDDLNVGERYMTFTHASGIQAEGKDINARRHISDDNWSSLKSDGADDDHANYIVWICVGVLAAGYRTI